MRSPYHAEVGQLFQPPTTQDQLPEVDASLDAAAVGGGLRMGHQDAYQELRQRLNAMNGIAPLQAAVLRFPGYADPDKFEAAVREILGVNARVMQAVMDAVSPGNPSPLYRAELQQAVSSVIFDVWTRRRDGIEPLDPLQLAHAVVLFVDRVEPLPNSVFEMDEPRATLESLGEGRANQRLLRTLLQLKDLPEERRIEIVGTNELTAFNAKLRSFIQTVAADISKAHTPPSASDEQKTNAYLSCLRNVGRATSEVLDYEYRRLVTEIAGMTARQKASYVSSLALVPEGPLFHRVLEASRYVLSILYPHEAVSSLELEPSSAHEVQGEDHRAPDLATLSLS